MFVIVSSITNWSGVFSRVPLNHVCGHMRADTRTLLSGLRLLHWEREGKENTASQSQFHTFSIVVRPVRHGCLWIWAGQGLVTPHCIEDRGISFTRTSILSSTKQVLSSVKSPPPNNPTLPPPLGDDRERDQCREMDLSYTQTNTDHYHHYRLLPALGQTQALLSQCGCLHCGMRSLVKNSTSGHRLLPKNFSDIFSHAHART